MKRDKLSKRRNENDEEDEEDSNGGSGGKIWNPKFEEREEEWLKILSRV